MNFLSTKIIILFIVEKFEVISYIVTNDIINNYYVSYVFFMYINVFLNKYTESGSQTVYSKNFLGIGIQPTIALQKQKKNNL